MTKKILNNDEEAQVGIGTMIVFIATILVAAVAAGVLIDTSQKLQSKSTQTGDQATEAVGNAIQFQAVIGEKASAGTTLDSLEIWVELSAGSEAMDLTELIIQYRTGAATTNYVHADTIGAGTFEIFTAAGGDPSDDVLESGELLKIVIGEERVSGLGTALALATSSEVTVELMPEVGVNARATFETPSTYGSKQYFELF